MRNPSQILRLPLILPDDAEFVRGDWGLISAARFRAHSASLASQLSARGEIVNLCEDRYHFLVAFAAALQCGKTTLLPPASSPAAIAELMAGYPDCETADDAFVASAASATPVDPVPPPADLVAAIGHTSGSTGKPVAHAKTWAGFCATTALNARSIREAIGDESAGPAPWMVATVPPQHMYGLETSVLLPLIAGFGLHSGRPLLPADVAAALRDTPGPRVLVSTPVHLRALVESGADFPDVAVVVSATAPLRPDVARHVEERLGATLVEMFGSTETCVIATRRTATQKHWRPYPGIQLEPTGSATIVRAPWLPRAELLQDILSLREDGSFTVIGRHSDVVEVAGKRASLADLTRRIASLPGVRDAHVFRPLAENPAGVPRCAALVVAPGLSAREILRSLRHEMDAAFLPRPLVVVAELPRNEVGKLPMARVQEMLAGASRRGSQPRTDRAITAASRPRRGK